jgi:hypothetical protein
MHLATKKYNLNPILNLLSRTKILMIVFIFMSHMLLSQKATQPATPYSYCNWSNVRLDKKYIPSKNDSCLFVVSTRNYNFSKQEFADYDYDTSSTLKYFAVYFKGNNWTAIPYSSLEQLLNLKCELKDVVVFTEGLGKTFTLGIDRATKLMRIYPVDGIFFDWPTERPYLGPGKNIMKTCKIAPKVAACYGRFLEEFQCYKNEHPQKFHTVTLLFHSMGNMVLMHNLKKDLYKNLSPGLVNNVILNAACVKQNNHRSWLDKLTFANTIYITINDRDRNLRGARIIFAAHQLGEKVKSRYSKKVNYVNFSNVLDGEHNYFLITSLFKRKPYLRQFYHDIFVGKKPQLHYSESQYGELTKGFPDPEKTNGLSGI